MKYNPKVSESVINGHNEVEYNEYSFFTKKGDKIKVDLQGKIRCPVLNSSISHNVCCNIMERPNWPRNIDPDICKKCNCFINVSIKKFKNKKNQE